MTTPGPLQRSLGGTSKVKAQAISANKPTTTRLPNENLDESAERTSLGQKYSMAEIYKNVTLALSQLMMSVLSNEETYMQIGISSTIATLTLGDSIHEYLYSSLAGKGSSITSCNTRWLPSGSLLFFLTETSISRLCTLSYCFSGRRKSFAPIYGDLIMLSPAGFVGRYYGIEHAPNNHPSQSSLAVQKASSLAWLVREGMSIPEVPQWIYVLLQADRDTDDDQDAVENQGRLCLVVWPAHLCLCKDPSFRAPISESETIANPNYTISSLLERAQAWLLGKGARLEALERKRMEKAAEARKAKEAQDQDAEPLADRIIVSQQPTPKDLSGIYPTPPDGLPTTTNETTSGTEPKTNDAFDGSDVTAVDPGSNQSFNQHRNDGLFEEMDIDIFANNGLTEDDFNFFDEPKGGDHHGIGSGDDHYALESSMQASPPSEIPDTISTLKHAGDTKAHVNFDREKFHQSSGRERLLTTQFWSVR